MKVHISFFPDPNSLENGLMVHEGFDVLEWYGLPRIGETIFLPYHLCQKIADNWQLLAIPARRFEVFAVDHRWDLMEGGASVSICPLPALRK